MKLLAHFTLMVAALAAAPVANAQVDWRFGFEDTWAHLAGLMTSVQKDALLTKLESITASQRAGGDININGLAGGWLGMQPNPGSTIDFAESDRLVQMLQQHGFSMLWNLRLNAEWASADNSDCYNHSAATSCAPDTAHEDDLYNYIHAIVEHYDGDGFVDMGYETPNDATDDLRIPIRFYLMTGEIEFAGATPPPLPGYGDAARNHFWSDSIENLLQTHRIIYRAVHDADPSGYSQLVSSGGIFWDLYSDFPDWPEIEGPTVQARLTGNNNHHAMYVQSFNRLKQMLSSFGNDADGIECDYIGWHPHIPWREIEQTFAFIKTHAGNKPIYVDDMWCNIFLIDRADAPGNTLFTGGGQAIEGDFPNSLIPSYTALKNGVLFNNRQIVDWYYARHARTIVKAFASVFGEGAERASISGIADFLLDRLNLMGTLEQDFFRKPGYYTYKLLVEKLHDFTTATEIEVSADPRTRVYRFERLRGPIYVMWSEAGEVPPDLDYSIATGDTVTVVVESDTLLLTHIIADTANTTPDTETLIIRNRQFAGRLGYEPIFLEPEMTVGVAARQQASLPAAFALEQNYPNPFSTKVHGTFANAETVIEYQLQQASEVEINIYDLQGQKVATLASKRHSAGSHRTVWNGTDASGRSVASGVYFYQLQVADVASGRVGGPSTSSGRSFVAVRKMLVVQ